MAIALANVSGTITDTYDFTAFGNLFASTGTTTNSYLYTGQQFDPLTELYSLRARYYDPLVGRFLSRDSFPVNFRNPIELNRYGYAANSPINFSDPSGLNFTETLQLTANKFIEGVENLKPYAGGTAALYCYVMWSLGTSAGEANVCGFRASGSDGVITIEPVFPPDVEVDIPTPAIGFPPEIDPGLIDGTSGGSSPDNGSGGGGPSRFTRIVAGTLITILIANPIVNLLPQGQRQSEETQVDEATDTTDDEEEPEIIVDFGPGMNRLEIDNILENRIRNAPPGSRKLVIVEYDRGIVETVYPRPDWYATEIANGEIEVIQGNMSDPNILRGRQAIEAFSIYPEPSGIRDVPSAFQQHVLPGGKVYMVTDLIRLFPDISREIQSFGFTEGLGDYIRENVLVGYIEQGLNGPGIGFQSIFSHTRSADLYLTKQ